MFLATEKSRLRPYGVRKKLRAMFPNVPFTAVEGSGHQVQNDKPEECNRLLLEFFGVRQAAAV